MIEFKQTLKNIYLCIKYPFLYPRNRFTGLHYNDWNLISYWTENYKKAVGCILASIVEDADGHESGSLCVTKMVDGKYLMVGIGGKRLCFIYDGREIGHIGISKFGHVYKYGFTSEEDSNDSSFRMVVDKVDGESRFRIINFTKDRWLYAKMKAVKFYHDHILQIFHCIPEYTELDMFEKGWLDGFGKELLKELKEQLVKEGMLHKFRITQWKEKWGRMELYCNAASKEVQAIIDKYSDISSRTCIECGKPAKYITAGYVCPYCEKHLPKNAHLSEVLENSEWKKIDQEEDI